MDILRFERRISDSKRRNPSVATLLAREYLWFAGIAILSTYIPMARGQAGPTQGEELFESKIRPVLSAKCYACHSSKLKSPMSGLTLDTKAGLLKGGDFGQDVIPGKP